MSGISKDCKLPDGSAYGKNTFILSAATPAASVNTAKIRPHLVERQQECLGAVLPNVGVKSNHCFQPTRQSHEALIYGHMTAAAIRLATTEVNLNCRELLDFFPRYVDDHLVRHIGSNQTVSDTLLQTG